MNTQTLTIQVGAQANKQALKDLEFESQVVKFVENGINLFTVSEGQVDSFVGTFEKLRVRIELDAYDNGREPSELDFVTEFLKTYGYAINAEGNYSVIPF